VPCSRAAIARSTSHSERESGSRSKICGDQRPRRCASWLCSGQEVEVFVLELRRIPE